MTTIRLSEDSYPRTIAATGDTVQPGGTVDVPDELAGRPPDDDGPGEGLLRQVDVWRPADVHVCDICGFEAKTAGGLATHANTHDGEDDE